jgi:hypothetical protein
MVFLRSRLGVRPEALQHCHSLLAIVTFKNALRPVDFYLELLYRIA